MARYETRRWEADPNAYGSKAARRSVRIRAFIPEPIADADPGLSGSLAAAMSGAERAMRALGARGPAQQLRGFSLWLLRAESIGSSWIEGHQLSQRRLARAEVAGTRSRDLTAQAVLGNVRAMERLLGLAETTRALEVPDLLEAHRALMSETPSPGGVGQFRTVQNWVGGGGWSPADASFIPPPPEHVPGLMIDLLRFVAREDLAPVFQAAVAHAQFEAIHPFADGNGRIGRALIHHILRRRGVAPGFVPPISLVLATHKEAYVAGLNAYTQGKIAPWAELFCWAANLGCARSERLVDDLAKLQEAWRRRAAHPRADSSAEALIASLPGRPVITVELAAALIGRSVQAANTALKRLLAAGVVTSSGDRKSYRVFEAREVLTLLDAFEKELAIPEGRRRRP
jgi:Fic family protein